MATYYVRRTGNDGNLGTSPSQAWLTVDHAANTVAAADTVYIGAGVYRELVTMDTSGSAGNQISFIGDIGGEYTGDPGPVIISAHDAENGAAARAYALNMNDKLFVTWQYVRFVGGTTAAVGPSAGGTNTAYEGCQFLDCVMEQGEASNDDALYIDLGTGAAPATNGVQFDHCVFLGRSHIFHDNNAAAHVAVKIDFTNCIFAAGATAGHGLFIDANLVNTYSITDVDVTNCTFIGSGTYAVYGDGLKETVTQCKVINCYGYGNGYFVGESACTNNALYEDYNRVCVSVAVIAGDIQQGGNSDNSIASVGLGGFADLMFHRKLGWSPWKPFEPMITDYYTPCVVGTGSAVYAPAYDVYNNPRPLGRSSTDDIGAVEANPRGSPESGTVRSGAFSDGFIRGAGYLDKLVQVDASSTTVEVYGRYDANYTGSNPILRVLNIPGVADQSDAMTGAAGAWEKLECTFTPTSAGFVRVRLESRDTSANGEAFFDDLRVK